MASSSPWKPLFWERIHDSASIAVFARDRLIAIARDLAPPPGGHGVERALSLIGEWEEKLAEVGKVLGVVLSWLGTAELLALRRMRSDDATEVRVRPRAGAARALAGAAYGEVATCRGHLGAAARLVARGDIPYRYADAEVLAAARAVAAALEQLHGVVDALPSRGEQAPALLPLPRSVHSDTRAAATTTARRHDDAWRALARSVPDALPQACAALPELEAACAELDHCAHALKSSLDRAATAATYAAVLRKLDAAHAAISRVISVNAGVSTAFLAATSQLGLGRVGPRWVSWMESRSDFGRHGRAALDLLWSASACVDYHFGIVVAWPASALQEGDLMLRRAVTEASEARDAAKLMGEASVRLFFDTSVIINGA
ncbi:hypothetical protein ACQJBY_026249 [Aegilops geniculata]